MAVDVRAMMAQYSLIQTDTVSLTGPPMLNQERYSVSGGSSTHLNDILGRLGVGTVDDLKADEFCDIYERVTKGYDIFRYREDGYRAARDSIPPDTSNGFAHGKTFRRLLGEGRSLQGVILAFEERGFFWDNPDQPKRSLKNSLARSGSLMSMTLSGVEEWEAFGGFCRKFVEMESYNGKVAFERVREYLVDIHGVPASVRVRPSTVAGPVTAFGGKLTVNRRVVAKPDWMN